jgi:signal transduction histidine kinase
MSDVRPQAQALPAAVRWYVAAVIVLSALAGALAVSVAPLADPRAICFWIAVFLAGEVMHLQTPTGKGNVSMAAALHLGAVPLLGGGGIFVAAWLARLAANLFVQRQCWYKALFNAAQVALAVLFARWCYSTMVGLAATGLPAAAGDAVLPVLGRDSLLTFLPAGVSAAIVYYCINVGLVCGVLSLVTGLRYGTVWRENYGYRVELVSSAALFLLAPVVSITYQTAGGLGILLFFLPMLFIRDACQRYIALEQAQRALIGSERLAAKGEMAASVGHELNNFMTVLSGSLQLMQMNDERLTSDERRKHIRRSAEQVKRMSSLSKGLMDFSRLDSQPMPTDLAVLVQELVEFIEPQNRFDDLELVVECDARIGVVMLDPAQIQQVLLNLLNNAADALHERPATGRRIRIWLRRGDRDAIELGVEDNGPGVPDELKRRIFEPTVTTKTVGHGFGLSTVYRIVRNHGGTITVEDAAAGGALFRIVLPAGTPVARATPANTVPAGAGYGNATGGGARAAA